MFAWIYICAQKVDISIRYLLFGTDRTSGPDFFPHQMVYNARCVSVCVMVASTILVHWWRGHR